MRGSQILHRFMRNDPGASNRPGARRREQKLEVTSPGSFGRSFTCEKTLLELHYSNGFCSWSFVR